MKKATKILTLGLIIIISGGILVFVQAKTNTPTETASTTTSSIPVIAFTQEEINQITLSEDGNSLSFQPSEDGWSVIPQSTVVMDQSAIDMRLGGLLPLSASRVITDGSKETFGLGAPTKTITYTLTSGDEVTLDLGINTPDGYGIYAMKNNDPSEIYILPTYTFENITANLNDYRNHTLASYDRNSLIRLEASGRDLDTFIIESHPAPEIDTSTHVLTSPTSEAIDIDATHLSALTNSLPSLFVDQFIEDNVTELSPYGLDQPTLHLQWEVHATDESGNPTTQQFDYMWGDLTPNGDEIYFKETHGTSVYTMNSDIITKLMGYFNVYDLSDKTPLLTHIDTVKGINITIDNTRYAFTIERSESEDVATTYYLDGEAITEDDFKTMYALMIGITSDTALPLITDAPSSMPIVGIELISNDETRSNYLFYPYDNQFYSYQMDPQLTSGFSINQFHFIEENIKKLKGLQ